MKGFTATGDGLVAELDEEERAVVARLIADVALLLGSDQFGMQPPVDREASSAAEDLLAPLANITESAQEPADPALLALLPTASLDDREIAEEFRRLTENDVRNLKIARLHTMWEGLSGDSTSWMVPFEDGLATASALTDVRLVLASRLHIRSDDDTEVLRSEILESMGSDGHVDDQPGAERIWMGMVFESLGWLQQSLMDCLTGERIPPENPQEGGDVV
ncbi:DUF2017 family protein [Demequina sediminicola]|uniref:DUF2017 family protein n=1 Tax=Demequina sediminicola TaxID=1095026 RepID=UPI0007824064|nr:DUF2017 family protein [Demequina sediminicola]